MNCNLLSFCLLCLGVADVTLKNFIFRYFIRGLCVLGKQVAAGCGGLVGGAVGWVGWVDNFLSATPAFALSPRKADSWS